MIFDEEDLHEEYHAWFHGNGAGKTQFIQNVENPRSYVILKIPFPAIKNPDYTGVITDEQIL